MRAHRGEVWLARLLAAMKDAAERRVQWVLGDLASFRGFDAAVDGDGK